MDINVLSMKYELSGGYIRNAVQAALSRCGLLSLSRLFGLRLGLSGCTLLNELHAEASTQYQNYSRLALLSFDRRLALPFMDQVTRDCSYFEQYWNTGSDV